MSVTYLLVVLGIAVFGGAVWALFWAVDAGQFEDLERQGASILEEGAGPVVDTAAGGHHVAPPPATTNEP